MLNSVDKRSFAYQYKVLKKYQVGIKSETDALITPVLADHPANAIVLTVRLGQKNAYG